MPKERDHIGYSPLTENIYVGSLKNYDGERGVGEWGEKTDRTSEFMAVLLKWCPPGYEREVVRSDGKKYTVTCREVTESPVSTELVDDHITGEPYYKD